MRSIIGIPWWGAISGRQSNYLRYILRVPIAQQKYNLLTDFRARSLYQVNRCLCRISFPIKALRPTRWDERLHYHLRYLLNRTYLLLSTSESSRIEWVVSWVMSVGKVFRREGCWMFADPVGGIRCWSLGPGSERVASKWRWYIQPDAEKSVLVPKWRLWLT